VTVAARSLYVVIALCLLLLELPTVAYGATVNAASCSRTDVGNAVTTSTYGDTVAVPPGTCTWTSPLTITKGITLQGAGPQATVINSGVGSGNYLLTYNPDSSSISNDRAFRITGFTFDMKNNSSGLHLTNNSSTLAITKVRIDNNAFRNVTGSGSSLDAPCIRVGDNGQVYGVIDSNTFTDCKTVGNNYGSQEISWNNFTFSYGTVNNMYWEDNTFTGNSVFHYGGWGGRYVSRFNTYDFKDGSWEVVWDVHGNQPGGVYSTMGCEIYRNTVTLARSTTILDHRGGSCMVFQNTLSGTNGSWQIREEYDDSIDPESNPQPMRVSNSYYFHNMVNGSNVNPTETQDCCNAIAPNVNYWMYTSSFNGSSGVGVGALSARPSSCTTGVGYWATDQGSWNSKGASGVFYKCTATNTWSPYYTPLAYPHPLRGAGSQTPPSAPTNVRIVR
jgi:hypothetical protein